MRYIVTITDGREYSMREDAPAAESLQEHIEERYLGTITVTAIVPGSDLALAIEREEFSR